MHDVSIARASWSGAHTTGCHTTNILYGDTVSRGIHEVDTTALFFSVYYSTQHAPFPLHRALTVHPNLTWVPLRLFSRGMRKWPKPQFSD